MTTPRSRTSRLVLGLAAVGLLAGGTVVGGAPQTADAHGGLTFPATRTYQCYLDGLAGGQAAGQGGNMLPTNAICQDALAYSSYPFYTWYGNLLSLVDGKHEETIPDGELCGPGEQFQAFNTPSELWPTTALTSGAEITFQYAATVQHPGSWTQYITKDGWDPTQPLGWDDIEEFDRVVDPPVRSGGATGPEYYWDATLPEKSGRHVIFSVWERSDSPESFYNCSDVVFGGGTGEPTDPPTDPPPVDTAAPTAPGAPSLVTASGTSAGIAFAASTDAVAVTKHTVHDAATDAVLASVPYSGSGPGSAALTGLTPGTSYAVYVVGHDAAGNTSPPSSTLTFSSGDAPEATCSVDYDASNAWGAGFQGNVTIANESMTPISGWALSWTFTNGETIMQSWSSTLTQTGSSVTARGAAWNSTIGHHGTVTFGFIGAGTPGAEPTFSLDGTECTSA